MCERARGRGRNGDRRTVQGGREGVWAGGFLVASERDVVWIGEKGGERGVEIMGFGKGRRIERNMGRNDRLGDRKRGRGRNG